VVHRMAALPGVVRHEQQAVQDKPHQGFHATVGMEGVMAALMGNHPAATGHGAGDDSIEQPEGSGARNKRDLGSQSVGPQREEKGAAKTEPRLAGVELKQFGR